MRLFILDVKAYGGDRLISLGIRSAVGSERIYGVRSRTSLVILKVQSL